MITAELVLDTLQRASSQQVSEVKAAEVLLADFETKPGFYSLLLNVISNHTLPPTVRWMAALTFKNGVDRYWRKTAPNAISEEEKQSLRCGLLCNFHEPINQVAIQIAVLIAKAARFDFPQDWPELVPSLLNGIVKGEDVLSQHRALLILLHVIKTLASKRLPRDRKIFQEVTDKIYSCIYNGYSCLIETFFLQVQSNNPECHVTLERALVTIRILRKLSIYGFIMPNDSAELADFVNSVFDLVKRIFPVRKTVIGNQSTVDLLEKTICHLMKVLLGFLERHPIAFIPYIKPSLALTVDLLFSSENEELLFPKLVVQSMNLVRSIFNCVEYQMRRRKPDADSVKNLVKDIKDDFFSHELLIQICKSLVTRYLPLTQEELELWDSDPEEFENVEVGVTCKYRLRSSIEALFSTLFRSYNVVLTPVIIQLVRESCQPVSPYDLSAIRHKDAVYLAVGLGAFDLYDDIDMDEWFTGSIVAECAIREGHYRILRRRLAWLLGEWNGVKLSKELRTPLYQLFVRLLEKDEDLAVRLAVAKALKRALDDFDFDVSQFIVYIESFVNLLFNLLREVKECETKMNVLTVLSFIVERIGGDVHQHIGALLQYLPLLWEESAEHNMLRCAIVSTLTHCARSLVSGNFTSFICPVLEICLDQSQEAHMYLMEDGLDLWLALMEFSVDLSSPVLQLLRFMPNILETTSEHMRTCCLILQTYIVLNPPMFYEAFGEKIFNCLGKLLNDVKPEGLALIYEVVELSMRTDTARTLQMNTPLIQQVFLLIYEDNSYPQVLSAILPILSRILLHSMEVFGQILGDLAQSKNTAVEEAMNQILESWLERMSLVTNNNKEKLLALALTSLINVDSPVVIRHLPAILRNIISALNDIMDLNERGEQIDTLIFERGEDVISGLCETEHEARLLKLNECDPVYKIILKDYFAAQMGEVVKRIAVDEIIKSVDPETLAGLKLYCF